MTGSDPAEHEGDEPGDTVPTYRQRQRPFGPEVTWRLEPDHLVADSGLRSGRVPYAGIAAIRLTYAPTNITSTAFKTAIRTTDGKTMTFGSLSWRTYFEVDRQDKAYRDFLGDLLKRAEEANPGVELIAGKPKFVWLGAAVVGLATTLAMAGALAWAVGTGAWTLAALAALFLAPFAWQWWGMVTRNRPGRFRADAVPAALMPD